MSTKINTKVNILNYGEQMPDESYRFRGYQLDELLLDIQEEAAKKAFIYALGLSSGVDTSTQFQDVMFDGYWKNLQKQKE